jgi:hypothetical protein
MTDPKVRNKYGTSMDELIGSDYRPTQRLANMLRSQGIEGFWTFSRAINRKEGCSWCFWGT